MNTDLAYGRRSFEFSFDEHWFSVLNANTSHQAPLSDFETGAAFDSPIASPPLDEIAGADDSVLIVVSERAGSKPDGPVNSGSEDRCGACCALEARLVNGYEVNGQTAWALLTKAERYRVYLVSELPSEDVKWMRMIPVRTISEALEHAGRGDGFILPRGAAVLPRVQTT